MEPAAGADAACRAARPHPRARHAACAAMHAELLTAAPGATAQAGHPQPWLALDEGGGPNPPTGRCAMPADRDQPRRAMPLTASPLRARRADGQLHQEFQRGQRARGRSGDGVERARPPQLSKSQSEVADAVLKRLRTARAKPRWGRSSCSGGPGHKLAVGRRVGDALNRRLHRIGLDALPAGKAGAEGDSAGCGSARPCCSRWHCMSTPRRSTRRRATTAALGGLRPSSALAGRPARGLRKAAGDRPAMRSRSPGRRVSKQCEAWLGVLSPALAGAEQPGRGSAGRAVRSQPADIRYPPGPRAGGRGGARSATAYRTRAGA